MYFTLISRIKFGVWLLNHQEDKRYPQKPKDEQCTVSQPKERNYEPSTIILGLYFERGCGNPDNWQGH
jgi:hypothetical protein